MNITCLFPKCEEQLQPHDLEDHIRRHFHLKLHRCFCGKRFYTLTSLDEHLETSADDETHCSTNVCPGDVYLKALVSRIVADFKSAENGASIPEIASNLRQRAHAVASRSTTVTPARTVGEKRSVSKLQEEVVPQKICRLGQMEVSADDSSRSASKRLIQSVAKSSERERNSSESIQRKEDHMLATREQSSASTIRTVHGAITDVISVPTLPIEKMTSPPELSILGDDARQKLPSLLTIEFDERRAHVANKHVLANQRDRRYTGDYRQKLAYQTPRRPPPYSSSRPTGPYQSRRSPPSPSHGAFRNLYATGQRRGRVRQQQSHPNHNRHRRGNRL